LSITWVQFALTVFIYFILGNTKLQLRTLYSCNKTKALPYNTLCVSRRPTVDSPFEKVQLGSILSYQVQIQHVKANKEIIMYIRKVNISQVQAK